MPTAPRLSISLHVAVTALVLQACLDPYGDTEGTGTGTGTTDTTGVPGDSTDPTEHSSFTTAAPVCGDGLVDADEQCDLGSANADDGDCTAACRYATCGDGLVNVAAEECDDGPANADDGACTLACKLAACGDGLLQAGEVCDDGVNDGSYGSCSDDCSAAAPACGDGVVDPEFEDCEDGPGCLPTCTFARSCLDYALVDRPGDDGVYTIHRDGVMAPIDVWCVLDSAVDGGGYTFLKVDIDDDVDPNPAPAAAAEATCGEFGMKLFIPRSQDHLLAAHAVAIADNIPPVGGGTVPSGADYLQILGIYPVTPGLSCIDQPFNDLDCPEWQASDIQPYWVSDAAVGTGEPDSVGACSGCSMLYQWNPDGSVKSYKAVPEPGGYSFRFLCDTGDKLP